MSSIIYGNYADCRTVVSLSRSLIAIVVALIAINSSSIAIEEESPIHNELRQLRDKVFAAYESRNIDALFEHVHPQVVATWQNSTRARGHAEVRNFIDEMLSGKQPVVKDVKSTLTVDGMSVLHGESTAIACGDILDKFTLSSGTSFDLNSKWTASVVKIDGRWQIASFHVSSNLFENPILNAAKSWLITLASIGGVIGLFLGLLIGRKCCRPKTA